MNEPCYLVILTINICYGLLPLSVCLQLWRSLWTWYSDGNISTGIAPLSGLGSSTSPSLSFQSTSQLTLHRLLQPRIAVVTGYFTLHVSPSSSPVSPSSVYFSASPLQIIQIVGILVSRCSLHSHSNFVTPFTPFVIFVMFNHHPKYPTCNIIM